jgi:hypothetical protein
MILDRSGSLHVFSSTRPHGIGATARFPIEHIVVSKGEAQRLQDISPKHAPVIALRVAVARDDSIHLLWVEDHHYDPKYHEQEIYLQSLRMGEWSNVVPVLDDDAKLGVLGKDGVFLLANGYGSLDVFWSDWREWHFFSALVTMGHGGNFEKTYHRARTGGRWNSVERVQRRGTFSPTAFDVSRDTSGELRVFWSKSSGSKAKVYESRYTRGRWRRHDTVAMCTSSPGDANIYTLRVRTDPNSPQMIAWVCSRFEYTVPGTRRNEMFHDLYVTSKGDGGWNTGPILSRQVGSLRWLSSPGGFGALLVKDFDRGSVFRGQAGSALYAITFDRDYKSRIHMITEAFVDQFEVRTEADGTNHVVYLEGSSSSGVQMKYLRGQHSME